MIKIFKIVFVLCLAVCSSFLSVTFAANSDAVKQGSGSELGSPLGLWKTIDDVTGKPKAIVQISQTSDKTLVGKILKIFPRPGHDQNELCTACEGDRHNKRIVGMVFMEKLKQNAGNKKAWSEGEILDPKNGKVYHCNLNVSDNSDKLNVRGYIGIPLFGRTQTWLRVSDANYG